MTRKFSTAHRLESGSHIAHKDFKKKLSWEQDFQKRVFLFLQGVKDRAGCLSPTRLLMVYLVRGCLSMTWICRLVSKHSIAPGGFGPTNPAAFLNRLGAACQNQVLGTLNIPANVS